MKNKKHLKVIRAISISLMLPFILCACTPQSTSTGQSSASPTQTASSVDGITQTELPSIDFSVSAMSGDASGISAGTIIELSDSGIDITGSGAQASDSTVTISSQGSYLISGTLSDGQIIIDTADSEEITLYLNGVDVYCSYSSPLLIYTASKKVVLYTVKDSINMFTDSTNYTAEDAENPDGCIYSKEDLELDGEGALYVTGNYLDGIVSKDDLEISGGDIYVSAADDGIRGKDSIEMTAGYVYITAQGDGMKSTNEEDTDKGYILISGGTVDIEAALDGLQAYTDLTITNGTIHMSTGGGSQNSSDQQSSSGNTWGNWGGAFGGRPGDMQNNSSSTTEDTPSAKGLKCDGNICITGGTLQIDSSDDSVHANTNIEILGGTLSLSSGDNGIHADESLTIADGTIQIDKSYEGLEALSVSIDGGTIRITSSDDGINAAGGSDGSSINGRPGQNQFGGNGSGGTISINEGYIVIDASGDGIDSNGNIDMSGGTVIVFGSANSADSALDYDGSFSLTGGFLLAAGGSRMAQSVSSSSQPVIAFNCSNIAAGTLLHIENSSGEDVLTFESPKAFSCIVFSSSELSSNETYTIYSGGSHTGTVTDRIYSGGSYSSGTKLGDYSF